MLAYAMDALYGAAAPRMLRYWRELEELEASDKNNEEIGAGRQKVSGPYSLPVFAIARFLYSLGESDVYFLNTVEK